MRNQEWRWGDPDTRARRFVVFMAGAMLGGTLGMVLLFGVFRLLVWLFTGN